MAYTAWDFLKEWDVAEQWNPFGNELAYEVSIINECTGKRMIGAVWAEAKKYLRDDLNEVMSDCEAIERIDVINPYTY